MLLLDSIKIEERIEKITQTLLYSVPSNFKKEFLIKLDLDYPTIFGIKPSEVLSHIKPVDWDFEEELKKFYYDVICEELYRELSVLSDALLNNNTITEVFKCYT